MSEERGRPGAFELLPWVPSVLGVLVMLGLLGFAVVNLRPSGGDLAATPAAPPPSSTPPFLAGPAEPEPPPNGGAATAQTPRPSPSPSPPTTTQAPPPPPLVGRFVVVDTFKDSFIGEVRVTNTSKTARGWTVRLRFGSSVGGLRTFWVERAPRPTLERSGDLLTFTSGAPIAAGKAAQLRFQLDRDGSGVKPSACSVNGSPCL
ncbi:cellulose binding domain-containing protein [Phytohabitans sp. LJ34]|uniref:cellulose binding domain-containing protein n=1 Tax=Phytohabitans sp. LJ34 TaxID=3452217 RepID=UPI003F89298F